MACYPGRPSQLVKYQGQGKPGRKICLRGYNQNGGTMNDVANGLEQRLTNVEEKFEYQEYTIEKLSDAVFAQQKQLSDMEQRLKLLEEKLLVNLPWRGEKWDPIVPPSDKSFGG